MPLDPAQAELVEAMKYRELQIKRKQRATDAVLYRERRFRTVLVLSVGLVAAAVTALVIFDFLRRTLDRVGWPPLAIAVVVLSIVVGVQLGRQLLGTRVGAKVMGSRERQLRKRYAEELNTGRRWTQFYYKGEDIAPYVPQILYFLESDPRFSTIDEALAFAKETRRVDGLLAVQAAKQFAKVAESTNLLVISSVGEDGTPSSRLMQFARSGRPGVWYIATTPDRPKVREFDEGRVALVTLPTPAGGTINSNRVGIARAPFTLDKVADLFEQQIPGYLDGVTEDEQRRELVYELTLQSARVDTWLDLEEVVFFEPK